MCITFHIKSYVWYMLNKSIHQPHKQLVNIAAPPNGVNQKKKRAKSAGSHMCVRAVKKKASDACW